MKFVQATLFSFFFLAVQKTRFILHRQISDYRPIASFRFNIPVEGTESISSEKVTNGQTESPPECAGRDKVKTQQQESRNKLSITKMDTNAEPEQRRVGRWCLSLVSVDFMHKFAAWAANNCGSAASEAGMCQRARKNWNRLCGKHEKTPCSILNLHDISLVPRGFFSGAAELFWPAVAGLLVAVDGSHNAYRRKRAPIYCPNIYRKSNKFKREQQRTVKTTKNSRTHTRAAIQSNEKWAQIYGSFA